MKLKIPAAAFRDPANSNQLIIRIEDAGDCDGSVCGRLYIDGTGEQFYPDPHHHLVESGLDPEAGPRIYAV